MANYPNQFKSFIDHKNLIDDVDANDINQIQSEIAALQATLGLRPQIYESPEASTTDFYSQITIGPNDAGGLESAVSGTLTGFGQTDRAIRANKRVYATVAARLDYLEKGQPTPAFALKASSIDLPSASTAIDTRPSGIRFPRPAATADPFSLHNGIGVTLKKSGFWILNAICIFNLQDASQANNYGQYVAAIDSAGEWLPGVNRVSFFASGTNIVVVRTALHDFLDRGTRISLRAAQNSNVTQKIRMARLSGHMVREN